MIRLNIIKKPLFTLLSSTLLLSSSALMAEDKVLAVVNGANITTSQLEIAATQSKTTLETLSDPQKKLLTEALINRQLVLDEAIKAKYDQDPSMVAQMKALSDSYLAASYLAIIAEKMKSSEQDMKAYYDKNVLANAATEYKARHILVKTEAEAKTIITEIDGGADFSTIAKEKSIDTGSGVNGGDLGWFTKQDMVASFSQAVANMKKGELNQTPIKSQFGWHVIILDDERTLTPPEYNAVKEEIDKLLIKEKLNKYLEDLNKNAKIELK
ncbi:MAG: peptidylprolyl isomerase [Gammaproteobacteria bacterium]|nr:peptidylprolyl isomerase [Gammaproteobacteria bacterium]